MDLTTLQEQGLQPDIVEELTAPDGTQYMYLIYFKKGKFVNGQFNKCMIKRVQIQEMTKAANIPFGGDPEMTGTQTTVMFPNGQADFIFDYGWRYHYTYQYRDNLTAGFNPEP